MKMTATTAETCVNLLTLFWTVATNIHVLAQQNAGCGSLDSQFAVNNLRNLSAGMSSDLLRKVLLPPLIAQPRVSGTNGNDMARLHIEQWMRAAGWTVEEDSFVDRTPLGWQPRRFTNVIATLNPNRPRRVVLACHFDSKLMPASRPRPFVGAIDSAVPCSVMMESAWQLRHQLAGGNKGGGSAPAGNSGAASNLTLQFIFFDGEEAFLEWSTQDSLYGARHLAKKWVNTPDPNAPALNRLQTIEVLILLDLIGTADTHFRLRFPQTAGLYNKLQNIESCLMANGYLKSTGNPVPLFTSQHEYNVIQDDHLPFLQRGVPVVHLITFPFPRVWHTAYDNEHALDYNRIDNLARILRVFLVDLPL